MKGRTNILAPYISPEAYNLLEDRSMPPVYIYQHRATGLPMACIAGGHQGHIIGGIIYFRDASNSMNMEIETMMDQLPLTFSFLEKTIGKPAEDSIEDVWERFMSNLIGRLSQKSGFTSDGTRVHFGNDETDTEEPDTESNIKQEPDTEQEPVIKQEPDIKQEPVIKQEQQEPDTESKTVIKQEQQDPQELNTDCIICMERPANTSVMPCLHTVVCSECSIGLKHTNDAAICCYCRNHITGVFYPDNTFENV